MSYASTNPSIPNVTVSCHYLTPQLDRLVKCETGEEYPVSSSELFGPISIAGEGVEESYITNATYQSDGRLQCTKADGGRDWFLFQPTDENERPRSVQFLSSDVGGGWSAKGRLTRLSTTSGPPPGWTQLIHPKGPRGFR